MRAIMLEKLDCLMDEAVSSKIVLAESELDIKGAESPETRLVNSLKEHYEILTSLTEVKMIITWWKLEPSYKCQLAQTTMIRVLTE